MPQKVPTPNTLSLDNSTPDPIPGLFSPVYEDIYPSATPRPALPYKPTSNTIAPENAPEDSLATFKYDMLLLTGIIVMLVWPWIFWGVVWGLHGIQMNSHVAKVVKNNAQTTTFLTTLLGNIAGVIVSTLFSSAIIRFSQEWVEREGITVFDISMLSAFRYQRWPWRMRDLNGPFVRSRWLRMVLIVGCIAAFGFVPSSVTSLITPAPFDRRALLNGTELDFSSNAPDCLNWFLTNPIPNNCDWQTVQAFKNLRFTNCLSENQMVDVLESGRGNILSLLSNNSQTLTFSQLGANSGMHFLGSIRGVLPLGPNGVAPLNNLQPSPFDKNAAAMISYNYTLEHQGLTSNITCKYDNQSPIRFWPVPNNTRMVAANASCDDNGLAKVLTNVIDYPTLNTNNTLTFWACKSIPTDGKDPIYYLYLRGRLNYADAIGNITCAVSQIQPAIFPVEYQSAPGVFSSKVPKATSANTIPDLIERAVGGLGAVILDAQNLASNLVAESIITFGVKDFYLEPYVQSDQYLRLYEEMIQGIIEYEATYIRLIYSTIPNRPLSCNRTLTGFVNYQIRGWFVEPKNIGFLVPMTILNLASLALIVVAMLNAKTGGYKFDPFNPNALLSASYKVEEGQPMEWKDPVKYRPDVCHKARGLLRAEENVAPNLANFMVGFYNIDVARQLSGTTPFLAIAARVLPTSLVSVRAL